MKRISILGSTGSIGVSTLDVVGRHPDRFSVVALAAGSNIELLAAQIQKFRPELVSVADQGRASALRDYLGTPSPLREEGRGEGESHFPRIVCGTEGNIEVACHPSADIVVSAIVGAAGMVPTYLALENGKRVALANKESLIVAGPLMAAAAKRGGGVLLPVDSEHSAIFQALQGNRPEDVSRIILTASGGPFLKTPREAMAGVTIEQALNHPNWKMGPKITVDSATLMNKGLEVIEATYLFSRPISQIAVHIHPQSIVHSMVEYCDGSVMAQLSVPDMRGAISYALAYPERVESGIPRLDLTKAGPLEFFDPDLEKFPCLGLGLEAARIGRSMPAAMNAANEVAVERFLGSEIGFTRIPAIIEAVMGRHTPSVPCSVDDLLETDRWARATARELRP